MTLPMDKQVYEYLLQVQQLDGVLVELCKVVFLNNGDVLENIDTFMQKGVRFLKPEYSQVYNTSNSLIFKSDEVFNVKVQLIGLLLKLREGV